MGYARSMKAAVIVLASALGAIAASAQMPQASSAAVQPEPNTTGPITRPMITEIATGVFFINEFGADSMFVVVGKTRALAIDSGSGFCDYKAIIESLTRLPYDVAITHGHPDHAGGIGQFDAVYMDPADIPLARGITYERRVAY